MPVIPVEGLRKHYGRVHPVDGFNPNVEKGTVAALIGPNGAGKTTTITMVLGTLRPEKGSVSVLGEEPWIIQEIIKRRSANRKKRESSNYFPEKLAEECT